MLKNNKIVMAYVEKLINDYKVQIGIRNESPLEQSYELSWDSVHKDSKLQLVGYIMQANDFEVDPFDEDFVKEISFYLIKDEPYLTLNAINNKLLSYYDKTMRELIYSKVDPMYQKDKEGITIYV